MGTLGTICSPIPHRRHKCIISFHVRTLREGWQGGAGDRVQKTSKIQKKPPNLLPNGVEKAGVGAEGHGAVGGGQKEPLKLRAERAEEATMFMPPPRHRPQKTQVNRHRLRMGGGGAPQELALGQQRVHVSVCVCV